MKVNLEVSFSAEEILNLCVAACSKIDAGQEGKFVAHFEPYSKDRVVVSFESKEDKEEKEDPVPEVESPPQYVPELHDDGVQF